MSFHHALARIEVRLALAQARGIVNRLERVQKFLEEHEAIEAKGKLNMLTVQVGVIGVLYTHTELDAAQKIVAASGPISFASDNPAVATVDNTQQITNPDLSVSVPVTVVGAGVAHITSVDPASTNKVAAGDTLTVTPPTPPPDPATSATGVLSQTAPAAAKA